MKEIMIPFNTPCKAGNELKYIKEALSKNALSGDGYFTQKCHAWFSETMEFQHSLLTTSGSMALDMTAILSEIKEGDEVIMPSFTFVSTANSFVLRGARIKFVDIRPDTMNINEKLIEAAISPRTKAIVPVHYAGIGCEMDEIMAIARHYRLTVIEDAAQAMMSKYRGNFLGGIGHFGCFSFHETKNYTSGGEGGLFIAKDSNQFERAVIIREKGTNRSQFFKGMVDKYTWVDIGSSYLPSDTNAAYLYANLEKSKVVNSRRKAIWSQYFQFFMELRNSNEVDIPFIPNSCEHNGHMFYIKLKDVQQRAEFISFMKKNQIITPFHYVPLHSSPAGKKYGEFVGVDTFTTRESSRLVRLPLFYNMRDQQQDYVFEVLTDYFKGI